MALNIVESHAAQADGGALSFSSCLLSCQPDGSVHAHRIPAPAFARGGLLRGDDGCEVSCGAVLGQLALSNCGSDKGKV
jgi:hypothetical protein